MRSRADLSARLARQWRNPGVRATRLLEPSMWPLSISVSGPAGEDIMARLGAVRAWIDEWRQVTVGTVEWQRRSFRRLAEPLDVPVRWVLPKPSVWLEAAADREAMAEFRQLSQIIANIDSRFHEVLVRRLSLTKNVDVTEVIRAANIAATLEPGAAQGLPLRALAIGGIDSKFFERHRTLMTTLLDVRFGGEVARRGLEDFLGAVHSNDHWLLVADLDGGLLGFEQLRIRNRELRDRALPGDRLLIVENEQCFHVLPRCPGTVAGLGTGLDLAWLEGEWLAHRDIAYWGDIDTWGLTMLAEARRRVPSLTPLLMTAEVFEQFADQAVSEPVPADAGPPSRLMPEERELYVRLHASALGRLEQERLPAALVGAAIQDWLPMSS